MSSQAADSDERFPLKSLVWPGSLLATIAHAIFVARIPFMAHEQSWDGHIYSVQDSGGSRGTIAFGEHMSSFVAVFYLATSERNPLNRGACDFSEATVFVRDVPDQLDGLSQEALQYVMQDVGGKAIPVITTAFWSDPDGSRVAAIDTWPVVVKHGAALVKNQVLPADVAIKRWADNFEFTADQIALANALFQRRLGTVAGAVRLTSAEAQQVRSIAAGDAGLQVCRESLAEVAIILP